ncbi:MAG: WbqC family protein [Tannerella sp.]|jgi:hypothetical protein|nr:WbqC family protein [Tannerella sp.]
MTVVYLSSAYLAPVQYYSKLFSYDTVYIETAENYLKQTYRNRCLIAGANGVQSLTVPVEKPATEKCLTKNIRISDHGHWRHLHWQALVSAYGMSPFFEYYQDDFAPFYERKFDFLFDFNETLRQLVCELTDIRPDVRFTSRYEAAVPDDFRETIRPKQAGRDEAFSPQPYYQVFRDKQGFLPNLSIVDLLFNMGPESALVLRDSVNCTLPIVPVKGA